MRRPLTASQWGLGHCLLPNQWQLEQQQEEGQAAESHPSVPAGAAIQMNNKLRSLLPRLTSLCVHAQQ